MVQQGWALAYVKYSSAYVHDQEAARIHLRGLWQGAFIAPWDWRHRSKKTEIFGALNVPIDAQKKLLPPPPPPPPDSCCPIKGNVNNKGERIYFEPDDRDYDRVVMQNCDDHCTCAKGKRWFCSAADAEAAGWRHPRR